MDLIICDVEIVKSNNNTKDKYYLENQKFRLCVWINSKKLRWAIIKIIENIWSTRLGFTLYGLKWYLHLLTFIRIGQDI